MTPVERPDDDFPIIWRCPEDGGRLWSQDQLHYPDPVTPLEFSLIEEGVDAGLTRGARAYGIPINVHDRHINGFLYTAIESTTLTGAPLAAQSEELPTKLEQTMANLRASWDDIWLPELQQHLAWWSAFDGEAATVPSLLQHLAETEQRWQRVWEIHFLLFLPSKLAISEFVDLHADLFQEADPFVPYKMLAGFTTKNLESGQRLWGLSRRILSSPDLVAIFHENMTNAVIPRLMEHEAGGPLLIELTDYLETYGQRADKLSLNCPYWIEDPTPVLETLKQYLRQEERNLDGQLETMSQQRVEQVEILMAQLRHYPRAVREEVRLRLKAAQEGAFLSEEHGHWIDYKASYAVRQVLLTIGRRFVADGVLPDEADLFYLEMSEVKDLLASTDPRGLYDGRLKGLAAVRRANELQFRNVTPPRVLGTVPSGSSAAATRDPITEMFHKVEGETSPESPTDLIVGIPGSPGVVEGPVRVLHALYEAGKVLPGDILVADTTSPPWTLLFATVGGLVTNSGGVLSHSAVIAREYGIPAVLGTSNATLRLRDGQRVRVDGSRGTVRLLG
jgi:rifampicin phosphotransferase